MIETLFSLPIVLFYAAFYGVTMKIADLLDEHSLKWFEGDAIIFGILWGIFGVLLIVSNTQVANVLLAMILAFIFRMRINYRNHAIATVIIITAFLLKSTLQPLLFFAFFANFMIFGGIKDYLDDEIKRKGMLFLISESGWYYCIPTLIYSLVAHQWWAFYVFTTYVIFYDIVKFLGEKRQLV